MAGRKPGTPKTGGRAKGTPNKTTTTAKAAIDLAAEKLGGGERLYQWTQEDPENEKAFWTGIYPRLLPLKHVGAGDEGQHEVVFTWRKS